MTLTPEQLEEAKQLLGVSEDTPTETVSEPDVTTEPVPEPETVTPAAPVAADNSLSVYCPNCSHLLAKVSNDAN